MSPFKRALLGLLYPTEPLILPTPYDLLASMSALNSLPLSAKASYHCPVGDHGTISPCNLAPSQDHPVEGAGGTLAASGPGGALLKGTSLWAACSCHPLLPHILSPGQHPAGRLSVTSMLQPLPQTSFLGTTDRLSSTESHLHGASERILLSSSRSRAHPDPSPGECGP